MTVNIALMQGIFYKLYQVHVYEGERTDGKIVNQGPPWSGTLQHRANAVFNDADKFIVDCGYLTTIRYI